MKKFNFIIGKRQIMISTLILILAIAAYLNWLAAGDQSITVMDVLTPKKTETNSQNIENEEESNSNYGTAELVSSQTTTDYFNQAKLQKTTSHAETSDALQQIIDSKTTSDDNRNEATQQALKLAESEKKENSIENQVRTKGFEDCVAYVDKDNVNVVVKTKEMNPTQAAQIKDIIVNVTKEKPCNIVITPME